MGVRNLRRMRMNGVSPSLLLCPIQRDKCKCGATTHLNANSKECPWNKKNLLKKKEINNEIICQPVNEIGEDSVDPTNV